jgi:ATP synthase I chain.
VIADTDYITRAIARIYKWMVVITAIGIVPVFIFWGWRGVGGFLAGAAISWVNFRWLKRLVDSLGAGPGGGMAPSARAAIVMGLRYLFLAFAAYVIVRFSILNLQALLAGIFVAAGAVVFEVIFELVYARN